MLLPRRAKDRLELRKTNDDDEAMSELSDLSDANFDDDDELLMQKWTINLINSG